MPAWSEFTEINRAYAEELYERFRRHPESLDPETRAVLAGWPPPPSDEGAGLAPDLSIDAHVVVGVVSLAESVRRYGHLAARVDSLGTDAARRSVARARDARRDRGGSAAAALEPGGGRARRSGRDGVRRDRAAPAGLQLDDGLRLRAHLRARGARVAAAGGRVRALRVAHRPDRPAGAARAADRGGDVRAVPAAHVPGQDALLDRGARHAGAAPRRGHRRGGRGGHQAGRDRHGAPRAPQRDGARAAQALRRDPHRVQGPGALAHLPRGHGVDRRREVPPRGAPRDPRRPRGGSRRVDAAEPEPPRGDRSESWSAWRGRRARR